MNLSDIKFVTPIGIELTMVAKKIPKYARYGTKEYESDRSLDFYFRKTREFKEKTNNNKEFNYGYIGTDPGVVEVSSPILRSWNHAKEWYDAVQSVNDEVGLTTFHEEEECGGGHIHFCNLGEKAKLNMFADLQSRPYIAWAFGSPYDDKNFLNFYVRKYDDMMNNIKNAKDTKGWYGDTSDGLFDLDIKCHVIRASTYLNTIEFRAFDSAADWSIQECHIAFIQRYVALMKKKSKMKIIPMQHNNNSCRSVCNGVLEKSMIKKTKQFYYGDRFSTFDECAKEFKEFITGTLELPWESYEWLLERNMKVRFKHGILS